MIAVLRTNDFSEGYKIVTVLKNPISEKNQLARVEYGGKEHMTSGILCEAHHTTVETLGKLTHEEQWNWLKSVKNDCFKF